jgi:putative MATE family efflux protein
MTAVTFSYAFVLRSTGNVKAPMVLSIIAIAVNTVLNYIMIFGKLGFPMLGVRGAAIATVIARAIEVLLMLVIVYTGKYAPAARIREMLDISTDFVKKFLHTALPVILNETLWGLGTMMYSVVYARMGTGVVAAANIASTVERVAMVLFLGMGNACAVMVGNRIGAGDEKGAFEYAGRMIILGPVMGIFAGITLVLGSGRVLSIFNISQDVYASAGRMLLIIGILMCVRVFNYTMIVGVLRSGGDTRFSLIIDIAGIWLISVPLAFVGGLVWKLPIHWVYLLVSMEELLKFFIGLGRFISKKWINNLVARMQT